MDIFKRCMNGLVFLDESEAMLELLTDRKARNEAIKFLRNEVKSGRALDKMVSGGLMNMTPDTFKKWLGENGGSVDIHTFRLLNYDLKRAYSEYKKEAEVK